MNYTDILQRHNPEDDAPGAWITGTDAAIAEDVSKLDYQLNQNIQGTKQTLDQLDDRLHQAEAAAKVAQAMMAETTAKLQKAMAKLANRQQAQADYAQARISLLEKDNQELRQAVSNLKLNLEEEVENLENQLFGSRKNLIKIGGQAVDGNAAIAARMFDREENLGRGIALTVPGLEPLLGNPSVDRDGMITSQTVWIFEGHKMFESIAEEWSL
jgi:ABC-type transporter Mla subunit MlaD